jgi:2',3'-cyclic-nucleotide 2'-phosphodiesterase (5'-nucleotidase family)
MGLVLAAPASTRAAQQPASSPPPGQVRPWTRALETFPVYSRSLTAAVLRQGPLEEPVFLRATVARLSVASRGVASLAVTFNGQRLPADGTASVELDLSGLARWGPNTIRVEGDALDGAASADVRIEIPRYLRALFLHANDIHGSLAGLAEHAAEIQRLRAQHANVYYVVAGDIFSGDPVSDLNHGRPVIEVLNAMRPAALAVGNHDFDHGPAQTQARRAESSFPWIGANIRVASQAATPITPFLPYVILTTDLGQRVALFGLTETPPSTRHQNVVGLEFLDPLTVGPVVAAQLCQQADLVVAVTHVGADMDRLLARLAPEVGLIIGGHSHTVLRAPLVERGVPIVQAGSANAFLGQVALVRDMATGRGTITARLIETRALRGADPSVRAIVARWTSQMAAALDRRIGTALVALDPEARYARDVNIGNLIADATRASLDRADVGMTNNGGIRASIPAGPLTLRGLYRVLPFGNYFMLFEITGEQLREVVRFSYARRNRPDLQVSGMTVRYIVDAEQRLLDAEITVGGRPLDPARRYRVGVNDYMGTGGGGYPFPAFGTPVDISSRTDVLDLAEFIEKTLGGVVNYPLTEGRVRVEVRR